MWKTLKKLDLSFDQIKICGTDEAGRGPIAGPVTAAAVILDYKKPIENLNDSKKLSEKKRMECFFDIMENAEDWAVSCVFPNKIDKLNILNASLLAMKQAILALRVPFDMVLVDGNRKIRDYGKNQETIVKGDSKSAAIAAASIVAKCSRDAMMSRYHRLYPQYGFNKHKGYPTKEHVRLLEEFGPSPIHRFSFNPVCQFQQGTLF